MEKEELFQVLLQKVNLGEISREEVLSRLNTGPAVAPSMSTNPPLVTIKEHSNFSITKLLYIIGSAITIIGVTLFANQIWPNIGPMGHITITLGLGVLLSMIGTLLLKTKETVGVVFHALGGLLIPGGVMVTLYEIFNYDSITAWSLAFAFGLVFAYYLLLDFINKHVVLTFFAIANGTAFIYFLVWAMTEGADINFVNLYTYLSIIIGFCYILLGYSFKEGWNRDLSKVLYGFGAVGIQCAIFFQYTDVWRNHSMWPIIVSYGFVFVFYLFINSRIQNIVCTFLTIMNGTAFVYLFVEQLIGGSFYNHGDVYTFLVMTIGAVYLVLAYSFTGGWNSPLVKLLNFFGSIAILGAAFSKIYGSPMWQLVFLVIVTAGFYFAVIARSTAILIINTIFLLSFISYITSEYFADSLGWPISLVILGFVFIGLGYMSININKKYIAQ